MAYLPWVFPVISSEEAFLMEVQQFYTKKNNVMNIVNSSEQRLRAARIETCEGPVLLANVYMPTDNNDSESYDEYVDMFTKCSWMDRLCHR